MRSSSAIYLSIKQCVDNGLWNEFSWSAFLRTYQIAHKVTATLIRSLIGIVSVASAHQAWASVSWMLYKCSTNSARSSAHTHLAKLHSIKGFFHWTICHQFGPRCYSIYGLSVTDNKPKIEKKTRNKQNTQYYCSYATLKKYKYMLNKPHAHNVYSSSYIYLFILYGHCTTPSVINC